MKHLAKFPFFVAGVIVGVFIYLIISTYLETSQIPVILILFFVPISVYLAFYLYYNYKYYINGVKRVECGENEIKLYFKKSIKKLNYRDIVSVKKGAQRVIIRTGKEKYIVHTYYNSPYKAQGFDYITFTEFVKKHSENAEIK